MRKLCAEFGRPAALLVAIGAVTLVTAGCGDAASAAPKISDLQVVCAASSDSGVDGKVLDTLSVKVTDPNRDLIGVNGTLNGAQMTLTDDDADLHFSWTPPGNAEPVACSGDFTVSIDAVDQAGHVGHFYKVYPTDSM